MDLRFRDDGDDDDGACVHERTALIGLGEFAATATTETETEALVVMYVGALQRGRSTASLRRSRGEKTFWSVVGMEKAVCLVLSGRCGDLRQDVDQNGCVRCQLLLLLLDATHLRLFLLARLLRLS